MKNVLLVLVGLAILQVPVMVLAQGGTIAVFADPLGQDCHPVDVGPGILQVYVVHVDIAEAIGSQFTVRTAPDFQGSYLGEYFARPDEMIGVGDAYAGIAMGYGECRSAPIHLLTMSFYVTGTSPECCYFEVVDYAPEYGMGLSTVDCDYNLLDAQGGTTFVNPDGGCLCDVPGVTTPVQKTTWSRIKEIYAQR
jgi:hypothetical protein